MIHYGMSKTALPAVSRGFAKQAAGTGVTVNSVIAGPTQSGGVEDFVYELVDRDVPWDKAQRAFMRQYRPQSLLQRLIEPEEIAPMVVYSDPGRRPPPPGKRCAWTAGTSTRSCPGPVAKAGSAAWLMTCTILTTEATEATDAAGPVHPRMPLALTEDHDEAWLDPTHQDPDELRALLGRPTDGHLDTRPVFTAVDNVRNNGPHLLDTVSLQPRPNRAEVVFTYQRLMPVEKVIAGDWR
ncbi:SOS response-associated peptidase family protein [Streptomyces echinatus]|uniref:SOS response-associated peptidase family protein n=1 Tax=Streptomyces echinatus TaxID=67293 RepID=UPI0037B4E099